MLMREFSRTCARAIRSEQKEEEMERGREGKKERKKGGRTEGREGLKTTLWLLN